MEQRAPQAVLPTPQPVTRDSDYPINRGRPVAQSTAPRRQRQFSMPIKMPGVVFYVVIAALAIGGVYLIRRMR